MSSRTISLTETPVDYYYLNGQSLDVSHARYQIYLHRKVFQALIDSTAAKGPEGDVLLAELNMLAIYLNEIFTRVEHSEAFITVAISMMRNHLGLVDQDMPFKDRPDLAKYYLQRFYYAGDKLTDIDDGNRLFLVKLGPDVKASGPGT